MRKLDVLETVATGLYSMPKDKFIESRRHVISDMNKEIAKTEQQKETLDPKSYKYMACEKHLEKCRRIIKDSEQLIFVTQSQMNLQTHKRYRGL